MGTKLSLIPADSYLCNENSCKKKISCLENKIDSLANVISNQNDMIAEIKKNNESILFPFAENLAMHSIRSKIIKEECLHDIFSFTEEEKEYLAKHPEMKELLQNRGFSLDENDKPSYMYIESSYIGN